VNGCHEIWLTFIENEKANLLHLDIAMRKSVLQACRRADDYSLVRQNLLPFGSVPEVVFSISVQSNHGLCQIVDQDSGLLIDKRNTTKSP
jgi:hypothetical protein